MKNRIKTYTEPKIQQVVSTMKGVDWKNERVYADFLAQIYYYVCHTTRILAAAGARFPLERQDLHQSCLKHASEEKSHELLSLNDLKTLGYKPCDFPELASTKAIYRSAFYLIEHRDPITLVGYAYFLEYLTVAAGNPLLEIVEPLYGAKAVRHLTVHTKEDPGHVDAVEKMLETLSERDYYHLEESISTIAAEFDRMLREVSARSGAREAAGKAAA